VDIYDGKLLVDSINRAQLPSTTFPFQTGYELVSIDGTDAQQILDGLLQYGIAANPRSTRRIAAQWLTNRFQQILPHAINVPDKSTVVFRRPDGLTESYSIPWVKSGLPLINVGRYITPSAAHKPSTDYMKTLQKLWNLKLPDRFVNGFGSRSPVFVASLPAGFIRLQGGSSSDVFYSGTFQSGGFNIGYIRIHDFAPANPTTAVSSFRNEITFFEQNTDGLVVDITRNPGGSGSYLNQLLAQLMPATWRSIAFQVRATSTWVEEISSALESAKSGGAPQATIDLLQSIKDSIVTANRAQRGTTDPIPLDDLTIDRAPVAGAYDKPIIVLVDEMSASAADAFAATIQDNGRGPLFGFRTMGAGGNVVDWEAGSYSLGITSVTESLMIRKNPVVTSDFPPAPYVENIGVRPDIENDYMTAANLSQNGKPFVDAFVSAIVNAIQKSHAKGRVRAVNGGQGLTPSHKESDFRFLASLFATYYAPYEWKKQFLGFDLLSIQPWLDRVAATTNDLDFYEVCVDYVASLN